jgi:TetR/AcrR family transcriptional regulator, ethionamide resistance regulator
MGVLGKRDGPQSARNNHQHRQLLEATHALLAEGAPYAELTVQRITARAGVSRPTFYAHFDDRRELLLELMDSALTPALTDLAKQGPMSGTALGPTRIRPTIALAMSIAREHAPVFRALIEASTYDDTVRDWLAALAGRFIDASTTTIRAQQAAGNALPLDPRAAATTLVWTTVDAAYRQVRNPTELPDDLVIDTLTTMAIRTVYGHQPTQPHERPDP